MRTGTFVRIWRALKLLHHAGGSAGLAGLAAPGDRARRVGVVVGDARSDGCVIRLFRFSAYADLVPKPNKLSSQSEGWTDTYSTRPGRVW